MKSYPMKRQKMFHSCGNPTLLHDFVPIFLKAP